MANSETNNDPQEKEVMTTEKNIEEFFLNNKDIDALDLDIIHLARNLGSNYAQELLCLSRGEKRVRGVMLSYEHIEKHLDQPNFKNLMRLAHEIDTTCTRVLLNYSMGDDSEELEESLSDIKNMYKDFNSKININP